MPSCDVNAATRLAEAIWRRDNNQRSCNIPVLYRILTETIVLRHCIFINDSFIFHVIFISENITTNSNYNARN